jgi:hypothetical protein
MSGSTTSNIVFTSTGTLSVDPGTPNYNYTLPSFLDPSFNTNFSTSPLDYTFAGSFNVTAGLTGNIAVTLGDYQPNIPVTVSVAAPTSVADGTVFTIDPTLVSVNDASFSLSGPGATVSLDLGLNGNLKLAFNQGSLIGASFAVSPAFSYQYGIPTSGSISIGPGTLQIAEPVPFNTTSPAGTAIGSLPTLSASGQDNPFFSASLDLVQAIASVNPALAAAISNSYDAGIGSFTYSILSAPLTAALSIGDTVSLTPTSIGVSITDELNNQTESGTLGQSFSFTAPSSGSGTIPLQTTYTLNYTVTSAIGIVGNLSLTIDGPQANGTFAGANFSIGPLGSDQLFSYSAGLGTVASLNSDQSLTNTQTYDIAYGDNPICYLAGTRILTPTGAVIVEDIAIGDLVVTRFGGIQAVKWIGRQNFDKRFLRRNPNLIPVCIRAGALGERLPARDLFVSPGHAMLIGDELVLASALVNGITITQDIDTPCGQAGAHIAYYQLDLGVHDCVIAEGTWSETFADGPGLREQFHNFAAFSTLFPDQPPAEALRLCRPRPERGGQLDRLLRPIVARASQGVSPGWLESSIDLVAEWRIEGWAMDVQHPELPVLVEFVLDGRVIGTTLACDYREDLALAGKGRGHCAFSFVMPMRLRPDMQPALQIRRAVDGTELYRSERCRPYVPACKLQLVA